MEGMLVYVLVLFLSCEVIFFSFLFFQTIHALEIFWVYEKTVQSVHLPWLLLWRCLWPFLTQTQDKSVSPISPPWLQCRAKMSPLFCLLFASWTYFWTPGLWGKGQWEAQGSTSPWKMLGKSPVLGCSLWVYKTNDLQHLLRSPLVLSHNNTTIRLWDFLCLAF